MANHAGWAAHIRPDVLGDDMSAVEISAITASADVRSSPPPVSWAEANQSCLVMEFARLHQRLKSAGTEEESCDESLEECVHKLRESLDPPAAIDQLSSIFELSDFERQVLLLCAGIEMDSKLASVCSEALGRDRRGAITFSLALGTLDNAHWSALAPTSPLRRFHLVELESGYGLTSAPLRIDERILHYLAGVNRVDPRIESLLHRRQHTRWIAEEHAVLADELLIIINADRNHSTSLHLCGDDPRGQEDLAALLAHRCGRRLYILNAENLSSATSGTNTEAASADLHQSIPGFVSLWTRESALLPAMLLVQCGTRTLSAQARQTIEQLPAPLIVASRDPLRVERHMMRQTVNKPLPASQRRLWTRAIGSAAESLNGQLDHLSEHFRLSAETIAAVGSSALALVESKNALGRVPHKADHRGDLLADQLWSACRSLSRPRLEDLAERIVPSAAWEDLILPEPQKQTLHQLAAQARQRMTVYEHWGFAARGRRGLGITALFAGSSGTGKTLAAEVLAKELRLDLFRIDLSAVVSKYIGESEKNLKQVFDAAEEGGVMLLFDEADALFGKRAEVKDSHDRYANIEVSYLLQRMESFQGLAVLTTNLKSSLDKAFQRRLRFTVEFPFPGPQEREAIWQRVFPAQAPTNGLNLRRLAQLNMTGGNIRNIALNAAFLAADAGASIEMCHVLQSTRQEAIKTERPLVDSEIRGWS